MYEMVTGRVPFDGDTTVAVAIQHLQEEIVPPSAYAPNLPISMEKIILKCTQKNPDRRYESMTALLADLRKALISPNEDFVVIAPVSQEKTRVIGEEEINKIKQETSNIYLSDEDVVSHNQNHRDKFEKRDRFEEDDEDDEEAYDDDLEEMNPKMDKAITIMGIAAGVIIVALIIFILVSFFGDFKFGGSSNKANTETSETQTDGIEVPDLKGLTFDEAKEQLNAKVSESRRMQEPLHLTNMTRTDCKPDTGCTDEGRGEHNRRSYLKQRKRRSFRSFRDRHG